MSFLIVRLGSLGDVIHGIPVAAALRRRFPHARIDWAADPRYADLIRLVPVVDHVVPVQPRRWSTVLPAIRQLRRVRYDAVIDLQGLLKSAVLARAAGGARTIGFPAGHLREPMARVFYTDRPDPGTATHVVQKNLALLQPLGAGDGPPQFPLREAVSTVAAAAAVGLGPAGYVLLNPGAAWPNKRWPPNRFGALAAALQDRLGARSLVLWGPGEEPLASAVVAAARGAAEASPPTTIVDLVALARRARLMVSGDTGPLHVAAAVGTPIVALFGPTSAARNGPWAGADITVSRTHQCGCLYERRCRRSRPCIEDVEVEEVVGAAQRRVQEGRGGA